MKSRRVVYEDGALADLERIFDWLVEHASPTAATNVVSRLEAFINRLDIATERGRARSDLREGLRAITFKRAVIAAVVDADEIIILRIFYGGEDWEPELTGAG